MILSHEFLLLTSVYIYERINGKRVIKTSEYNEIYLSDTDILT